MISWFEVILAAKNFAATSFRDVRLSHRDSDAVAIFTIYYLDWLSYPHYAVVTCPGRAVARWTGAAMHLSS